jgi:hypothetical protein
MAHPGLKAPAVVVAALVFVALSIVASGGALIAALLVGVGIYLFGSRSGRAERIGLPVDNPPPESS